MQTYELYLVTNKINGKRYVGQTLTRIGYQTRWQDGHVSEALSHQIHHLGVFHAAIKSYGVDNFEVKRILKNIPEDQIDFLETLWIEKLNTFYITGHGYNMTKGGQGVHGYKHTDETKQHLSATLKKRPNMWTPELIQQAEEKRRKNGFYERRAASNWKQKLSVAAKKRFENEPGTFLGKHHTDEAKQKISDANTGLKRTAEVKLAYVIQRGTPVMMCDAETGQEIMEFQALSLARDYLIKEGYTNTVHATDGIRAACKMQGKVMYGFQWKFVKV